MGGVGTVVGMGKGSSLTRAGRCFTRGRGGADEGPSCPSMPWPYEARLRDKVFSVAVRFVGSRGGELRELSRLSLPKSDERRTLCATSCNRVSISDERTGARLAAGSLALPFANSPIARFCERGAVDFVGRSGDKAADVRGIFEKLGGAHAPRDAVVAADGGAHAPRDAVVAADGGAHAPPGRRGRGRWRSARSSGRRGRGRWRSARSSGRRGHGRWRSAGSSGRRGHGRWRSAGSSGRRGRGRWRSARSLGRRGHGRWRSAGSSRSEAAPCCALQVRETSFSRKIVCPEVAPRTA